MSEIIKTEAIVLSKMNYGDSSSIASLFTEDLGKISVIVKGARSPKSKYGKIVDPLNYLAVVLYKKESREIQLLSQADIVEHYPNIKNDLSKLGYAYGVAELVKNLLADHEVNKRIFKGIIKILTRLNSGEEKPEITFGRFDHKGLLRMSPVRQGLLERQPREEAGGAEGKKKPAPSDAGRRDRPDRPVRGNDSSARNPSS